MSEKIQLNLTPEQASAVQAALVHYIEEVKEAQAGAFTPNPDLTVFQARMEEVATALEATGFEREWKCPRCGGDNMQCRCATNPKPPKPPCASTVNCAECQFDAKTAREYPCNVCTYGDEFKPA